MKTFLLLVILLLTVTATQAQYGRRRYYQLGIGAEAAVPAGSYMSTTYKGGIGARGSILLPVGVLDVLSITGSVHDFIIKNGGSDKMLMGMVGYRHSIYIANSIFYIEPGIGGNIITSKRNSMTYSAGVGRVFAETWDLSLRYQSAIANTERDKISFIGLSLSYDLDLW